MNRLRSALAPLRYRNFRLLFFGRVVSFAGSAMAPVALAFAVLDLDGSPTDLGIVLALAILPQIFFLLIGGVIADRLPRHLVMVASNLVAGVAQAVAAVLLISGRAEIWQLAVIALARAVAASFFFPAQQGIVPQTVPGDDLQSANALLRLALNATISVAPRSAACSSQRRAPAGRLASMRSRFSSRLRSCCRCT